MNISNKIHSTAVLRDMNTFHVNAGTQEKIPANSDAVWCIERPHIPMSLTFLKLNILNQSTLSNLTLNNLRSDAQVKLSLYTSCNHVGEWKYKTTSS